MRYIHPYVFGLLGGILLITWSIQTRPMVIVHNVQADETHEVILIATTSNELPEELMRIADCESGNRDKNGKGIKGSARHYTEDGEVLVGRMNKPELGVDIGKFQINEYFHKERAEEMGLNLYNEHDNEQYALMLYKESGNSPWEASRSCWQ